MSVEEIAQLTGMTTNAFRQRLQQLTGETPKAYITAILMQKAVNLLTTTNMSVNDVARACGYTEQSNFSRTFKRIYGVTPSQYVK
jgi:AraC-like DNA-binding protein